MGMIKTLVDSAGNAINWNANALTTGPKASEIVNISQHNSEGILVIQFTNNAAGNTAMQLFAGIDETNMSAVLGATGVAISLTPATARKVFHISNIHATFIQLRGSANGTSGAITGIKIIAK
jgi:hypothetical protein